MRLKTRIGAAYIIVFIVPVVLILGAIAGLFVYSRQQLQKKYDLDKVSYDMLFNPTQLMGHMASSVMGELDLVSREDPDRLSDQAYLAALNEKLLEHESCLLVRRDGELIYSGIPGDLVYDTSLNSRQAKAQGGLYIGEDPPYYVQARQFVFTDGSKGEVLVYTNVEHILPRDGKVMILLLAAAVLLLSLTSAFAMIWLYRSIIYPLDRLKKAAQTMTAGNLNVSVTAESDDEIGELCTAFEEMRIKLRSQIEQNMQYEKDSKELISNISHDLKTPMTSIKGYVEGLMDGVADTPEKQQRYIRTIYNKVNDMNSLIEELFLYAKLDSNAVTYQFVKVNLSDYFEDCVEEIRLDLEAQNIDFGYFNYVSKDTVIIADPEQLKRVINNIIGNSIKYASPDRKPYIGIRLMEEAEFVKVEIEDNGKGIAKKEVPYIFDRSYRTDASRNSSMGGSGLGLSIARKIIEEHGGKIWANSTENVGTTIHFVIRKYKETVIYE